MWFRFFVISVLNFVASVAAILASVLYILPSTTPLLLLSAVNWLLAFLITCLFCRWAFSQRLPTRQDALLLVIVHLVIFVTGYLTYGIFMSDRGPWVIVAPEVLIQFGCEIAAIMLVAYHVRRRRLRTVLGEGMEI